MYTNTKTTSTIITGCSAAAMSLMCTLLVAIAFVPKQTVKFQDLNVASPNGAAALYDRLHAAAQHVCFADWDRNPAKVQRAEECASEAEARAVSKLNVAELTAYYQMKANRESLSASLAK